MANVSQTTFSNAFSSMKVLYFELNFNEYCPINNKSTLFQVMAWRRTGHKALPEPMLRQFTDAYMRRVNIMHTHDHTNARSQAIRNHSIDIFLLKYLRLNTKRFRKISLFQGYFCSVGAMNILLDVTEM